MIVSSFSSHATEKFILSQSCNHNLEANSISTETVQTCNFSHLIILLSKEFVVEKNSRENSRLTFGVFKCSSKVFQFILFILSVTISYISFFSKYFSIVCKSLF